MSTLGSAGGGDGGGSAGGGEVIGVGGGGSWVNIREGSGYGYAKLVLLMVFLALQLYQSAR